MKIKTIYLLIVLFVWTVSTVDAQRYQSKPENYFGIQVKPLIPFGLVGDKPFTIKNDEFESTIKPTLGFSYGGAVRIGFTDLLALETGISFTKRNYRADYAVADSNITAHDDISYINFEIPLNFLVYIQLGEQTFMNVSVGASANFNPSNVRSGINAGGKHLFIFEGKRLHFFDFNANANVGFEYRTEKSGTFYLGISARIPFTSTLAIATEYRCDTYSKVAYGLVEGATFAFDIKYFFHNTKRKKGVQFKKGPIEQ